MPLIRLTPKPGINAQLSQTQNSDGWHDSNLVRWKYGLLEKIGGWERLIEDQCDGFIRELHAWQDLDNNRNLLIGTDAGAQIIVNDTLYTLQASAVSLKGGDDATQCVTFSATNLSTTVTVNTPVDLTGIVNVGDTFELLMPVSIGGRILNTGSTFTVATVTTSTFTFAMSSAATFTETAAVGIPKFTISSSTQITTVDWNRHGLSVSSTFTIDQTTTSNDIHGGTVTIPGGSDVTVLTVPNVNRFTFDSSPFGQALAGMVLYEGMTFTEGADGSSDELSYGNVISFGDSIAAINPLLQSWYMDNLGEVGLLVYSESGLYIYQPPIQSGEQVSLVGNATPITAPQRNHGMLVAMPQAQVLLWGTEPIMGSGSVDPLLIRFSDVGTYDTWTATASNQAGSYRLSKGSMIVGAIQAPQTTLIFTDVDLWSMSYQGPPLVYGFTVMGTGCGLIAPRAVGIVGRTTYWMGTNSFWMFGEGGVRPLPCAVWDTIFRDLDRDSVNLAFAAVNSGFNEIAFFYPSLEDAPDAPTNLLGYSEDLANGLWSATGVTVADGFSSPDGGTTAAHLVEDTTQNYHGISQIVAKSRESLTYTVSIYAQGTSNRWLHVVVNSAASGISLGNGADLYVNPIAGTVASTATSGVGFTVVTSGVTTDSFATGLAGNGWLRYFMTFTTDATEELLVTYENLQAGGTTVFYTGNGSSFVYVWGAMLNLDTFVDYETATALQVNNPTRYVKYNVAENVWDQGQLERTAWIDDSIFGTPLGGDVNFRIQQHEIGYDDDGDPMEDVFAETGYGVINDGSTIMMVDQCQPDMKWFGNDGAVTITLKGVKYPGGPPQEYGPYSATPTTQFFSTRVRAKQVALRYDWAPLTGYSARVGITSFRVKPAGTRP